MKAFLSYTQSDISLVEQVAAELRKRGFEPWLAPSELVGGDHLSEIEDHLQQADFFLVFISRASVNSKWVDFERSIAIQLYLSGHLQRIVPCVLEEDAQVPVSLVDFVSVRLRASDFMTGIDNIVAALRGEKPNISRYAQFQNYVDSLIGVDKRIHGFLADRWGIIQMHMDMLRTRLKKERSRLTPEELYLESLRDQRPAVISFEGTYGDAILLAQYYKDALRRSQPNSGSNAQFESDLLKRFGTTLSASDRSYLISRFARGQPFPPINSWIRLDLETLLRSRKAIEDYLAAANVTQSDTAYVLNGIDQYGSLRVISDSDVGIVKQWVRHADEELVHLAAVLFQEKGTLVNIESKWLIDVVVGEADDPELTRYRAEQLAHKALTSGLLEYSTAQVDANGYDFGLLLWRVGPIACCFELEHPKEVQNQ